MESHAPSRKQAIIFFLCTLGVAVFIFLWVFFLNQGTLTISGTAPFSFNVKGETTLCENERCSVLLKPGKYEVEISKEGFFDLTETASVKRKEETVVAPKFIFIPKIAESKTSVLPYPNAPLTEAFLGRERLPKIPSAATKISFSASGKTALVTVGRELYAYDTATESLKKLGLARGEKIVWLGEELAYLENEMSDISLKKISDGGEISSIISFKRPFESPTVFGSSDGNFALIADRNAEQELTYYLIDIAAGTRKILILPEEVFLYAKGALPGSIAAAGMVRFEGSHLLFQTEDAVLVLDPASNETVMLPAVSTDSVLIFGKVDSGAVLRGRDPGGFIFLSATDRDENAFGSSIEEVLQQARKESSAALGSKTEKKREENTEPMPGKILFVTQYSLAEKKYRTFGHLEVGAVEPIGSFTMSEDGRKVYFKKGEKVFELILEPSF